MASTGNFPLSNSGFQFSYWNAPRRLPAASSAANPT